MSIKKETEETWNSIAQLYEDNFMDFSLYDDSYDLFCKYLTSSEAHILEIGCGPGNITKYLKNKLPKLKILATDIAQNMIQLGRKNLPDVEFKKLDGREILDLKHSFDGIICGFTLPYLSADEASQFIIDSHKKLNDKGLLYLSFVPGKSANSGYKSGGSRKKLYFNYHEFAKIKLDLKENNFTIISKLDKQYTSQFEEETHTVIIAQK